MSNPQQETKIELVTEAIESLTRAVVAHQANPASARSCYDNVVAARKEVASALRELLTPTLRLVTSQKTDRVGDLSTTLTHTVIEGAREIVEYHGGIDDMNLA